MANNEQKSIAISTIPIPKLTVVMNNFICNTINHLNKLSVKGDEKLAEFDKKLNDLEIMTTLLEAKLNSLPEKITSTYPPLQPVDLPGLTPTISIPIPDTNYDLNSGSGSSVPVPPPEPPKSDLDNQTAKNKKLNENAENDENDGQQPLENQTEGEGGGENLSPQDALENFLKAHEKYRNLNKMLNLGVPSIQIRQKAKMNGFDMDVLEELISLAQKVNPSIS